MCDLTGVPGTWVWSAFSNSFRPCCSPCRRATSPSNPSRGAFFCLHVLPGRRGPWSCCSPPPRESHPAISYSGLSVVLRVARLSRCRRRQAHHSPLGSRETLLGRATPLSASGSGQQSCSGRLADPLRHGRGSLSGVTALASGGLPLFLAVRYAQAPELPSLESLFAGYTSSGTTRRCWAPYRWISSPCCWGATCLAAHVCEGTSLHVGPQGLGLLRAAPAAARCSVTLVAAFGPGRRAGGVLLTAVAVFRRPLVVSASPRPTGFPLLALGLDRCCRQCPSVVVRQTLVQGKPRSIRGRVSAVNSIFIGASNQLGEFESRRHGGPSRPSGSVVLGRGHLARGPATPPLSPAGPTGSPLRRDARGQTGPLALKSRPEGQRARECRSGGWPQEALMVTVQQISYPLCL